MQEFKGFKVGQRIVMRAAAMGCTPDDDEVIYPAGSPGRIDAINNYGGAQGVGFEISIWADDPEATIVNVFDEGDGEPGQFFAAAE